MADFRKLKDLRNKLSTVNDGNDSEYKKILREDIQSSHDEATKSMDREFGWLWEGAKTGEWGDRADRKLHDKRNSIPKFHGQLDKTVTGDEPKKDLATEAKIKALRKIKKSVHDEED